MFNMFKIYKGKENQLIDSKSSYEDAQETIENYNDNETYYILTPNDEVIQYENNFWRVINDDYR